MSDDNNSACFTSPAALICSVSSNLRNVTKRWIPVERGPVMILSGSMDTFPFSWLRAAAHNVSDGQTGGSWKKSPLAITAKSPKASSFSMMCCILVCTWANSLDPTLDISSMTSKAMVSTCALSLRILKVEAVGFSSILSPLWDTGMPQKLWIVLPLGKLLTAIP